MPKPTGQPEEPAPAAYETNIKYECNIVKKKQRHERTDAFDVPYLIDSKLDFLPAATGPAGFGVVVWPRMR